MRRRSIEPLVRYVRSLGDFYLTNEVAEALDVTAKRLRILQQRDPQLGPSARAHLGADNEVWLYTADDVNRIVEHLRDFPPEEVGAERNWTVAEYRDRQRRDRLLRYYRSRVEILEARGDSAGADKARHKARELARELNDQRAKRIMRVVEGL